MSRFTAPLVVTPLNDGRTWRIVNSTYSYGDQDTFYWHTDFRYDIGEKGSGLSVQPPANFETDFASIPRLLWWLLPVWGRYGKAAVIHDYLYRGGKISVAEEVYGVPENTLMPPFRLPHPSRQQADQIMLEAMEVLEVPRWQRRLIYAGVRVGGWWAWRRNRQ